MFLNDLWHGSGMLLLQNGDKFAGNFFNGSIHGFGTYTHIEKGIKIIGKWNRNKLIRALSK
jgi:hypothetical protein